MKERQGGEPRFDRPAFEGMAAVLVVLFLVHSSRTIDPDVLPRFVYVACVMALFLLIAIVKLWRRKITSSAVLVQNTVTVSWCVGIVVGCVSILVAINRSEALYASLRAGVFFILFMALVALMLRKTGRVKAGAAALAVVGLVLGLVGVFQLFHAVSVQGWTLRATYLVRGLAGHRNFLAQTLVVTLPFAAWVMVVTRGVKRLVMAVTIIVATGLIAVLMVRSVWIASVIAILASGVLGVVAVRKRGGSGARGLARIGWITGVVILAGVVVIFGLLGTSGRTALVTRIQTLVNPASGSAGGRLFIWQQTFHMIHDHPFLGVGGGNWRIVFPKYAGNRQMMRNIWKSPRRPHNDYLWILAENGPAGLLAYLVMIATLLWWTGAATLAADDAPSAFLGVALFFAEIAYVVFSAFSFPRERIGLSVVMTLVFAMTTAIHLSSRPTTGVLKRNAAVAMAVTALVVTCLAGLAGVLRLQSEAQVKVAYRNLKLKQYRRALSELDRALSPFYTVDRSGFPVRLYRAIALEALGREDEARDDLERACRASPYNVMALDQLALSYARLGNGGEAILLWQRVLKIHPGYRPAVRGLAVYAHEHPQP